MLIIVLVIGLLVRLFLARFGTLWLDMTAWISWSNRLAAEGLRSFYYQGWSDYLPSYLYILRGLATINQFIGNSGFMIAEQILYKLPSLLADLGTAYLIFFMLKQINKKTAWIGLLAYLFNPAVIANSTLWGQADSFFTFFLVLSFVLYQQKQLSLSSVVLAFASLLKPLGFLLVPLYSFPFLKREKIKKLFLPAGLFTIISLLLFIPFSQESLIAFIYQRFEQTINQYRYTSLNAFNFWGVIGKLWVDDSQLFLGLPLKAWGTGIFGCLYLFFLFLFTKSRQVFSKSLIIALTFFASFLFLTRMHERHLFPVFPFLIIGIGHNKDLLGVYLSASLIYCCNLFYAHQLIEAEKRVFNDLLVRLFSIFNLLVFGLNFYLASLAKEIKMVVQAIKKQLLSLIKSVRSLEKIEWLLVFLLLFSLFLRLLRLGHPQKHIFDEVYHAFTAGEMAVGNEAAWQWWNSAPEGFAYEWTHPPLAKLLMAGGIKIFGNNSFGWRFPSAVFGTGVILLTYLIGKRLFNKKVGFFAALFFSFDGLLFVMSRVGMADVYLLFFILLTLVLVLKEHLFWGALCLGLSLATKWTSLYLFPLLAIISFYQLFPLLKKGDYKEFFKVFYLRNWLFLLVSVLVYLAVYLPFFIQGHSLAKFATLQQKMWNYHTQLKATHDYQSQAYTWPFMIRPVWFWVDYQKDRLANIYNLGNPLLWWSGILLFPLVLERFLTTIKDKFNFSLLFILVAYLFFWLPWIFSPRIMFLHHYLTALPFLSLYLSWFFNRFLDKDQQWILYIFTVFLVLIFVFFYPIYTGIALPKKYLSFWFWLPSWR
jgi:Gpi18-like mannosyltransferase